MVKAYPYKKYTHVMCDVTEWKSKWVNNLNIVAWQVIGKDCFEVCNSSWFPFVMLSQFNDGTNKGYHLLIHHKELEQLKAFVHEKIPLLKSPQNRKKASNTAIMEKKDK